VRKTSYFRAKW